MSKKILEEKIMEIGEDFAYRKEEKINFLLNVNENSPEKTTKLYMSIMKKTIDMAEQLNGREWMDFSKDMVDGAFIMIEAKSIITLQSYLSIIKDYLTATTPDSDNYQTGYNYTLSIDKDGLKQYINPMGERNRYVTPQEFDDMIKNRPVDPLGKSLFVLLYLGVKGKQFKEICDIKDKDIDLETGIIKARDGSILCTIPKDYITYFDQALEASYYYRYDNNGKIINESEISKASDFFVKRRVGKSNDKSAAPDTSLISNTMTDAQKSIRNKYITPVSIYLSGEAYRLIQRCGMKMPTNQDLKAFREETGSTLSFVSMKTVCGILLEKLGIETP